MVAASRLLVALLFGAQMSACEASLLAEADTHDRGSLRAFAWITRRAAATAAPPEIAAHADRIGVVVDAIAAEVDATGARLRLRPCEKRGGQCFLGRGEQLLEIDSTNFCTVFVLDKWHIATAGHCFVEKTCRAAKPTTTDRHVVALGVGQNNFRDGELHIPRERFIATGEAELVACVYRTYEEPDWAILRVRRSLDVPAMPLASVGVQDRVKALGFPAYRPISFVPEGVVRSFNTHGIAHGDYRSEDGQSGSPVFDDLGQVVGVHGGRNRFRDRACFTPIQHLIPTLTESRRTILSPIIPIKVRS